MKKTMKLLALVLCLVLSMTMLAACGGDDEGEKAEAVKVTETKPASAEDVAKAFMKASVAFKMGDALKYIKEDTELYNEYKEMGNDTIKNYADQMIATFDETEEQIGIPGAFDKADDAVYKYFEDTFAMVDYEIVSAKEDGNKATVEYKVFSPNASLDDALMSVEEAMTEDKIMELMGGELSEIQDFFAEIMQDAFDESLKDVEMTETQGTIELEKVDDTWLVIADN